MPGHTQAIKSNRNHVGTIEVPHSSSKSFVMDRLDAYVRYNYKVPGWLHWYSARIIVDLSHIQVNAGFEGAVGEIGVHMGRLFILLKLLASPHEKAIAIDVFEDQHLNVDRSGCGDQIAFLTNLERWASTRDVELIQRSSLEVSPEEIIARVGKCRIISVDAGHTEECTVNDLYLAEAAASDHGIIILDDFFNAYWPDG
jgi:Methyltransferase domain